MSEHVFTTYFGMTDPTCLRCDKRKSDVEKIEHYIFESGYCDPNYCPRCKAEICIPHPPASIK
jgi:hypothetical protein